jgi:tRNA(Ile)-lysidine synthase
MGAARVLVAHTRDDLLETVLMRVLRGSGPAGLAAMRRDNGSVLRPLLDLGRPEVLAYLAGRGVPFRTDSTNADPAFLRNRIRNALVPQLDGLFPGWKTGLLSLVQTQRRTAGFLSFFAESAVPWEAVPETPFSLSVSEEAFFSAPEIVREEALFLAADRILAGKQGGAETGQLRRENVRRFCETRKSVDLGKIRAKVRQGRVVLEPRGKDGVERGFSRLIKEPGLYKINGMTVRIRRHSRAETGIPAGAEGAVSVTLPLVLRPPFPDELKGGVRGFTALLAAEDAHGTAALIGRKGTITEILKGSRRKPQSGFCLEVVGSE